MKQEKSQLGNAIAIVTLVLGLASLAAAIVYFGYRFLNDRAYTKKWQDYDDCGIA